MDPGSGLDPGCRGHFPSPSPARNSAGKGLFPPVPAPLQPGRVWAGSGFEEFESTEPQPVPICRDRGTSSTHQGWPRATTTPAGPGTPGQTLEKGWAGEEPSALEVPLLLPGQAGGEGPTCQGSGPGGAVFVEINHRGEQCGRAGSGLRAAPSRRLNIYLSRSCLPVMDRRFQGGAAFCSSTQPGPARCPAGDGATNHSSPWGHCLRLP